MGTMLSGRLGVGCGAVERCSVNNMSSVLTHGKLPDAKKCVFVSERHNFLCEANHPAASLPLSTLASLIQFIPKGTTNG